MRIALGISYDGTNYYGWQNQTNLPSVQSTLEAAISKIADQPIAIICAGRTDRGVHALGQVIHFDTDVKRNLDGWLLGINTYLPKDIRVQWVIEVEQDFHARFSALTRSYQYIIYNHKISSALDLNRTAWHYKPLDETRMVKAAAYLLGKHDFSSYRASGCQAHSPVRTIHNLTIIRQNSRVIIDIRANAFLHHMVRNIAGVLMTIGDGRREPEWAKEVLIAKNRIFGGITASPAGLYFMTVEYPERFSVPVYKHD